MLATLVLQNVTALSLCSIQKITKIFEKKNNFKTVWLFLKDEIFLLIFASSTNHPLHLLHVATLHFIAEFLIQ